MQNFKNYHVSEAQNIAVFSYITTKDKVYYLVMKTGSVCVSIAKVSIL
jgi:hypothetical protein